MKHLIEEKIEFATVTNISKKERIDSNTKETQTEVNTEKVDMNMNTVKPVTEKDENESNIIDISGSIKAETEKALLVVFNPDQEVWIPKSTIHSNYKTEKGVNQKFSIDEWVLKRNNINLP